MLLKKKLLNYAYLPEFYHTESWVPHYKKLWVLGDLDGVKDNTDQRLALEKILSNFCFGTFD